MPSDLDRAIAAMRRRLVERERQARSQMLSAYRRAIQSLEYDLRLMQERIAEARANGERVNRDWLRREQRYRRLITDAETAFARFTDDALMILRDGQLQLVSGGALDVDRLVNASGLSTDIFAAQVNRQAMENLVASFSPDSPVRAVLDRYGARGSKIMQAQLVDGLAQGRAPSEITRNIKRFMREPFPPRIAALVRTELMRSYRGSLAEQLEPYEHLAVGYRWVAAKSTRTCLACLAKDGSITKQRPTKFHVNCRCTFTLVPKDELQEYERGEAWFRRQPEDVQRAMMPSADAFTAYRDGKVSLADFVGEKRSRVWGASIRERSGREVVSNLN